VYWRYNDPIPEWSFEGDGINPLPSNCLETEFRKLVVERKYDDADA
jgi:hypothetical protein